MENNIITNLDTCIPSALSMLGGNFNLLYYSHIPLIILSLFFGIFVLLRGKNQLSSRVFFVLASSFALWSILDLLTWLSSDTRVIMFSWSFIGLVEIAFFVLGLYFFYVFVEKKDVSWQYKVLMSFLLLPPIFLLSTNWNLSVFMIGECYAVENTYGLYYKYLVEAIFTAILVVFSLRKMIVVDKSARRQVILLFIGIMLFLLSFFFAVFVSGYLIDAGITNGYGFEIYGLFGMVIFMGFLAYLIVKFKAFDIKLIGAQALVVTQFLLIGSMLTVVTSMMNYILVSLTLIITLVAGWILIRSVRAEVQRKEELQKLSNSLAVANDRLRELDMAKSEFISIASHQLRTPLTAIKGYVSLILEGSYGKVPVAIQDVLDKLYTINSRLVQLVEDLLNISRIEAGRIQYAFAPTQLEPLVAELVDMFALAAKNKKLSLKIHLPKVGLPKLTLDAGKIKEVVSNLIDNALKYTKEGGVTVSVDGDDRVARIIVADTGIGIHPEDKNKLFEKFSRINETTKMAVSGTGLGLFVGKNFIAAHGGHIHVESDGPGKGSRFIIELPLVNPKISVGTSDQASFEGLGK